MSKLYLGTAKVDITPKVGCRMIGYESNLYSEEIHDNLDATAFVFQQGENTAVLVSATVCVVHKDLSTAIRNRVQEELGIPYENIIIAATHTHSGPATGDGVDWDYCDTIFIPQIMEAIRQAKETMQAVTMGYAFGESKVGINRREPRQRDNKVVLGQCPWGPFDPRMTVISFKNEANEVVATMIHYGAHATASGINHSISQDWPGVMVRRMEALTGATAAFFNGAIGDVGPRIPNGCTVGDIPMAQELGGVAAQDATRVLKSVTQYTDADMKATTQEVQMPLKKRISLEEAQEKLQAFVGVEGVSSDISIRQHYEDVVASYENGYEEQEYETNEQPIVRIGNLVFLGFGYELFSEISLRIQKENKNFVILPLTNANAYYSYFPTQSALGLGGQLGGYEVQMFKTKNIQEYVDDVDYRLVCESLKNIEKVV